MSAAFPDSALDRLQARAASAKDEFQDGLDSGRAWSQPTYFWFLVLSLGLNMFSGYWGLMSIPLPLDRLFLVAGLILAALDSNVGLGRRLAWRPLHWMMLVFSLWTLWSAMSAGSFYTSEGFFALLDRIVVPFVLFCLAPVLFDTPQRRDILLKMLTLSGIYLGVLAFLEMIGPKSLVWPRYIMDPYVGILFGRARGPFVAAEADGMILALSGLCAMILFSRTSSRFWRRVSVVTMVLTGIGTILTMTRSIWLGAAMAVGVYTLLVPALRRQLPKLIAVALGLAGFVLIAIAPIREALLNRLTTERSINDRQNTNAAALRILHERPLTGIGWHEFISIGPDWVRQADTYPITNVNIEVHNVVLSRAAELGIPAALLWVAIVVMGPVLALRAPQVGDLAAFRLLAICYLLVWIQPTLFSPNPYPMPNNLMWIITGIVAHQYLCKRTASGEDVANVRNREGQGSLPASA